MAIIRLYLFLLGLIVCRPVYASETRAGFFLPEDVSEVTFKFRTVNNLVVLPVVINDSVKVNLILDTGCRNLVLFGRKFLKFFETQPEKKVQFSGLGSGDPLVGNLALNNKVSIHTVLGENIPLVIIPQQSIFARFPRIDGVIGYDIFVKFEIELEPITRLITFRSAASATLDPDYTRIPIRIEDSRPLIQSKIFFDQNGAEACDLMLDTGSSLGLLVKTTDSNRFPQYKNKMLGHGLNGPVKGIETNADKVILSSFELSGLAAGITYSPWHNYASIGMAILKDYSIVLNYCKAYAGIKKNL